LDFLQNIEQLVRYEFISVKKLEKSKKNALSKQIQPFYFRFFDFEDALLDAFEYVLN